MKNVRLTDTDIFDILLRAIDQTTDSVVITDAHGIITHVNPAFLGVSGYTREEVVGMNPRILKSGVHPDTFYKEMWDTLARGEVWWGRLVNRRKDGSLYEESASICPIRDAGGRLTHFLAVKRDISKERSLENQLIQAQKMEALARISGGIAHDFNNLLTSIIGSAQLLAVNLPPGTEAAADAQNVIEAGQRAAALTRQLLVFSRHEQVRKIEIDLDGAIVNVEKMLRRTVAEDVTLTVHTTGAPAWIKADASYIDQVVLNLVVNARDAMPDGGALNIVVERITLNEPLSDLFGQIPLGRYCVLSVSDSGTGITPEVMKHLFEPFFTTKEQGKGTGLGLSTVYGIIKNCEAYVNVETQLGRGTTFHVYFPEVPPPESSLEEAAVTAARGGAETILVVEDEVEVAKIIVRGLMKVGYSVLISSNAEEAIAIAAKHQGNIDMLLSDVVLPGAAGPHLAEILCRRRPAIRVMFMSGHPLGSETLKKVEATSVDFLKKPFLMAELRNRVRAALDVRKS
jgi:PAS domain S-box-containing protein